MSFITAEKCLKIRAIEDLRIELRLMEEISKNYVTDPSNSEEARDKAFFTYLMDFKERITNFKLSNSSLFGVDY